MAQANRYLPNAAERIKEILAEVQVATERELKVRLERDPVSEKRWGIRGYFPWTVGFALQGLINRGVKKLGYRGRVRLGSGTPSAFYSLNETQYSHVEKLIQEKRKLTYYVNALITEGGVAAAHAEELFLDGMSTLNFNCLGRDVSEFRGRKVASSGSGPPPNIDFVMEKNGITYGVDIKNWIKYERDTVLKVKQKVDVAIQLNLVPFIIARYVDDDTMYREIIKRGGLVYRFWDLLIPSSFYSLAAQARDLLGYPVTATDVLPDLMGSEILNLHEKKRMELEPI
ncbi:MAG: hypothetical protein QXR97_07180 [Thermoproteota archaeon]